MDVEILPPGYARGFTRPLLLQMTIQVPALGHQNTVGLLAERRLSKGAARYEGHPHPAHHQASCWREPAPGRDEVVGPKGWSARSRAETKEGVSQLARRRREPGPWRGLEGCCRGGARLSKDRAAPSPSPPHPGRILGRVQQRCGEPTWAFCRALSRSSCTKGFRPGGASLRASPAPELEEGAARGPRPRSLMAARAWEPSGADGAQPTELSGAEQSRAQRSRTRQR